MSTAPQPAPPTSVDHRSLALGIATYVIWGFFPLYFHELNPARPLEVIAHRAFWGLCFCLIGLVVLKRWNRLVDAITSPKIRWRLTLAGFLVVINWTTYVFAIQTGHTVDAAIGYFINPLVTVALSMIVRRERTSTLQKIALGFGAVAVAILILGQGRLPWVSLTLALSFGFYSLVKKDVAATVDPLAGMAVETAAVAPVLLAYLAYLAVRGQTSFNTIAAAHAAGQPTIQWPLHLFLLIGAGLLTVIPLVMFATAARGLPLATLGFIQYLSPVLQMAVGIIAFHEVVEPTRWIATGVVWIALVFLSVDIVLASRRRKKLLRRS
ncbi:EamA family transporter RarD [Schaalia vaccimaxillae]|uniref:EamA family transporter RarD n=1 Tax=Schaalia vaccimaxillae TaxID=183916 RepID=UPI0003B5FA40|nr:EamA family transporter RarD [Schaalia vaccimaxillae]